jgi:hypothetical protein
MACIAAALLTAIPGTSGLAQTTGTARPPGADSAVAAAADSARIDTAGRAPGDTLARADTLAPGAPGDTTSRPRSDTAPGATPAPPPPPPEPVDSVLGAACAESGGGLPDLLTVKFHPATTASEREAVAREIGGTLAGPSEHGAPGAWYIQAPGAAAPSTADRLIVLAPVLEVGNTRCPPQAPTRP